MEMLLLCVVFRNVVIVRYHSEHSLDRASWVLQSLCDLFGLPSGLLCEEPQYCSLELVLGQRDSSVASRFLNWL